MKDFWKYLFLSVAIFILQRAFVRAEDLSLVRCYELALQKDESIRIQSQRVMQAGEAYQQARGTALPQIQFNYSHFFQDTTGTGSGEGGVGGTLTRQDRPEAKFSLQQTLFAGFREYDAMSALKSISQKETFLLKNSGRILFENVAAGFYSTLQIQKDLRNVRATIFLAQERVKELETRVQLGKSRPSELLSVESQLATLQAQEEKIKGDVFLERESLSLLIGKRLTDEGLTDDEAKIENMEPIESILEKAFSRTELKALKEQVESKKAEMKIARSFHFPIATALGNYYLKRVGVQEPIDWDILLNIEFPIFEGGVRMAALRKAASEFKEAELELNKKIREIESEARKKYARLNSSVRQLKILEIALKKAEESYGLQAKEYRLGLVNNLEVLQAMNVLQETRKNYDRARIQAKLNYLEIKIATEELP